MSLPTGSSVGVQIICTGKRNLPQVKQDEESVSDRMKHGTAVHKFLEDIFMFRKDPALVWELAIAAALANMPEGESKDFCKIIDPSAIIPNGMVQAESAYAYRVSDGHVVHLGAGLSRQYGVDGATHIPATADCVCLVDRNGVSHWCVGDYKVTDSDLWAPPPQKSGQLKFLGLCVMKLKKLDHVILQTIRISGSGKHYVDEWTMDQFECDAFEKQLRHSLTAPPVLVEGAHCQACNAFKVCPAKTSMIAGALEESDKAEMALEITEQNAPAFVQRLEDLEDLLGFYREQVKEYAKNFPVQMPNGDVYGPKRKTYRSVTDPDGAWKHIAAKHGEDKANRIMCTKKSMKVEDFTAVLGQKEADSTLKHLEEIGLATTRVTNNVGLIKNQKRLKSA